MKKELAIKDGAYALQKPSQMTNMAQILKHHIVSHNLYTNIVGKNYAHVEGWQFAGGLLGVFPRVVEVKDVSKTGEIKWLAEVELVEQETGKVVSRGFAVCSNKEAKKKSFDEYAVLSMAQTRAIGKAYRNLIGWVMKLAGYEATPTEEMVKMGDPIPSPKKAEATNGQTPKSKVSRYSCSGVGSKGCQYGAIEISQQVAEYSKKLYGKALCRDCQKDVKTRK